MGGGYEVVPIPGLRSSEKRGIVFLRSDANDELNASTAFDALPENVERKVRDRMDYWIDGGVNDNYFHGWPNDANYKECFTFKWNYRTELHRFYGFLYHPLRKTNARFLLCVLLTHAVKNNWNTDPKELGRANALRVDPRVIAAIAMAFPDEHNPCLN
jgi:hypothetical protein